MFRWPGIGMRGLFLASCKNSLALFLHYVRALFGQYSLQGVVRVQDHKPVAYRTVAYISGPYRAPTAWQRQENIRRAMAVALDCWKMGYAAICPPRLDGEYGRRTARRAFPCR